MELGLSVGNAAAAAATAEVGTALAPGFRFHPTDEELVCYYLRRKVCGMPYRSDVVNEIDVYRYEPAQLAEYSALKTRDQEWYFFSAVDKKYGNGSRLNRATGEGYWKATGKDRSVFHNNQIVGMKKTLVFHSGRAPEGRRTNWVMHEYRLSDPELEIPVLSQDTFVICRIFVKRGEGPPSGNRYAPFLEEEWDNEAMAVIPGGDAEDDAGNANEERVATFTDFVDTQPLSIALPENPNSHMVIPYRSSVDTEVEPIAFLQNKRSRRDDPSSSYAHESEDSTTTSQVPLLMLLPNDPPRRLEYSFMGPSGSKPSPPSNPPTFDSATLEKTVPPGFMKFIRNLENQVVNSSMEKESLKIEVMRAQATISVLQSNIETLTLENEEFRRRP